jgi:two-component system, LuxR family, sensor kinase FixL
LVEVSQHAPPPVVRYAYGIVAVMVALGAALALHSFDLEGFLFVIAVAVAVWFGGRGPGLLAVALSMIVLDYFFLPAGTSWHSLRSHVAYFLIFTMLAVLITLISEMRHRTEQSLVVSVQERTAELERSNQQLRAEMAERRRAEDEIRQQAALLGLAHDAIIVRDLESRIQFWNRGAEETYGWASSEVIGRVTHDLLQTTFPASLDAIHAMVTAQGNWEGELRHVTRAGAAIVVASRWSLQRDQEGKPIALMEINRDISDRKRAEEALRRAETELAHVTRVSTVGEVTASFAHEVNQPLAAIANNASACLGLLPGGHPELDEVREALVDIVGDAERAGAIIERVGALVRRSGSERAPTRLERVVEDVVALTASDASMRGVTIRTDLPPDLPAVMGDRVQLQQVLLNLVVNGMDAMSTVPEQTRLLLIRGRRDTQDGVRAAAISVHDHGVGLRGTDAGRLFDAFYTTKPHGMGMGLAISRSIIEAHGGRLWAEDEGGPGATFSFTLPAAAEPGDA